MYTSSLNVTVAVELFDAKDTLEIVGVDVSTLNDEFADTALCVSVHFEH